MVHFYSRGKKNKHETCTGLIGTVSQDLFHLIFLHNSIPAKPLINPQAPLPFLNYVVDAGGRLTAGVNDTGG
jgi:hypothetical protein